MCSGKRASRHPYGQTQRAPLPRSAAYRCGSTPPNAPPRATTRSPSSASHGAGGLRHRPRRGAEPRAPSIIPREVATELNTLLQERGGEEAEEDDAAPASRICLTLFPAAVVAAAAAAVAVACAFAVARLWLRSSRPSRRGGVVAQVLNTLLQEGRKRGEEEADAAATAARHLAAPPPAHVDVARRVVAKWRTFVAERKRVLLLRLLEELPDLFFEDELKRLDLTARTMLAQVGRPWLAAVIASGFPRLPKGGTVWIRLRDFCSSAERIAWARPNGCWWGGPTLSGSSMNPFDIAAASESLDVLRLAWKHEYPLSE